MWPCAAQLVHVFCYYATCKFLLSGIEDVISIFIRAAVAKGGVESLVESMVSVVEAHNTSSRGILHQERLEDEVMVVWNGEDVMNCDSLVRETMM